MEPSIIEPSKLLWPLFVSEKESSFKLPSFFTVNNCDDALLRSGTEALELGLGGVILYELGGEKSEDARASLNPDGVVPKALATLKRELPELFTIADLGVCQYTTSSHCRVGDEETTAQHLFSMAKLYCESGAHALMPSGMIPRFSKALREWLKERHFSDKKIISQTAKFTSSLYSPFQSSEAMNIGVDKSEYQLDPRDRELALQLLREEKIGGADVSLIKPAIPYLSLFRELRSEDNALPLGAFITSGEHDLLLSLGEKTKQGSYYLEKAIEAIFELTPSYVVSYLSPQIAKNNERSTEV